MAKKHLSILLAALFLFPCLAGCNRSNDSIDTTVTTKEDTMNDITDVQTTLNSFVACFEQNAPYAHGFKHNSFDSSVAFFQSNFIDTI